MNYMIVLLMTAVVTTAGSTYQVREEAAVARKKQTEAAFHVKKISEHLQKRMLGKSFQKNSHIQFSDLRYIQVKYYDFNGKAQTGEIVVHHEIADDTADIFKTLYQHHYPIEKIRLIDEYDGDDNKSMADNNTSAFNYRTVPGTDHISKHSFGRAIDINPRMNPYVRYGEVMPPNGEAYVCRDVGRCTGKYKKAMIHRGDFIYRQFIKHGFTWGGDWSSYKDYQHFVKEE